MSNKMNHPCDFCGLSVSHIHPTKNPKEVLLVSKLENKEWSTYDLGLACTLAVLGLPIKRIDADPNGNTKKRVFVFEDSEELQENTQKYWNRMLRIDAQTYFDQLKNIKNRLYSDLQ